MGWVADRVEDALKDKDAREFAESQLEVVRTTSVESERIFIKLGNLILVFSASFLLIDFSALSDVTTFGFKFTNIDLLLKILPAVVAILYYRMLTQLIRYEALSEAYSRIVKILHPEYYNNDLEVLNRPPALGPEFLLAMHTEGVMYKVFQVATAPVEYVFTILPLAFICYAYWHTFSKFGALDLWTLGSAIVSGFVLLQTFVYWIASRKLTG